MPLIKSNFILVKNYDLMPPLHKHDSYFDCTKNFKDSAVYCVSKTYIKPDNSSIVWKHIKVRFCNESTKKGFGEVRKDRMKVY